MEEFKSIEREIEEKQEELRKTKKKIEEEIENLLDKRADFIMEHCQYKDKKNNQCTHFEEELDDGNCSDCAFHLDIHQIRG